MRWKIVIFPNVAMTFNLDNRIVLHLRHWGERIKNGRFVLRAQEQEIRGVPKPYGKLGGFWQVFVLLDHLRRQHFFNGPGDPRPSAHTGALQLGIGGFPAFNVLRAPPDQNACHAPSGFLRHHGHGEV